MSRSLRLVREAARPSSLAGFRAFAGPGVPAAHVAWITIRSSSGLNPAARSAPAIAHVRAAQRAGRRLVQVGGDVRDCERSGERGGGLAGDLANLDFAAADRLEHLRQRGNVEHVLEAFAIRLDHDREGRVRPHLPEQVRGSQALHPERGAAADAALRQQERAGCVLAEPRREQGRVAELVQHAVRDAIGVRDQQVRVGRGVGIGEANRDPVVSPRGVHVEA